MPPWKGVDEGDLGGEGRVEEMSIRQAFGFDHETTTVGICGEIDGWWIVDGSEGGAHPLGQACLGQPKLHAEPLDAGREARWEVAFQGNPFNSVLLLIYGSIIWRSVYQRRVPSASEYCICDSADNVVQNPAAGRIALVAGAASSIGYATVSVLIILSFGVIGADLDEPCVRQIVTELVQQGT